MEQGQQHQRPPLRAVSGDQGGWGASSPGDTSSRSQVAWTLGALSFAMGAGAVICYYASPTFVAANASLNDVLVALFFGPTGTLLALRRPESPIGWIFCGMGIASGLSGLGAAYGGVALVSHRGSFPFGGLAAWISSWTWMLGLGATMFLFMLFPTGRYLSRRWFWVGRFGAGAVIASSIIAAFLPLSETMPGYPATNPVAVLDVSTVTPILIVLLLVAVACFILSFFSLIVRFKRSRGDERAQLKWLALAGGTLLVILALSIAGVDQVDDNRVIQAVEVLSAPVAISVAILKYRLYDIDVVINRALVYGSLTSLLAGIYVGFIALLQLVLEPLTAQNDLAVVVSTLAVAALFRPLRARLQTFIDQRFYRRKYDAAATLEGFAVRLRDEVDLDSLSTELVTVVGKTMQPAHASLWLRTAE